MWSPILDEPTIDWRARAKAAEAGVAALEKQVADLAALAGRCRLARDETTGLPRDLLGVERSEGTIQAICERVSGAVAASLDELEAAPPSAAQVSMNETGWKQRGVRRWLWTASTARFAVSAIPRRRSSVQVRARLPNEAHGVVSADRWSAYRHLEPVRPRLRRAHLDRDLQGIVESPASGAACPSIVRRPPGGGEARRCCRRRRAARCVGCRMGLNDYCAASCGAGPPALGSPRLCTRATARAPPCVSVRHKSDTSSRCAVTVCDRHGVERRSRSMRIPPCVTVALVPLAAACATDPPVVDGLSRSVVQGVVAGALVSRSDIDPTPLSLDCDEPAVTCELTATLDDNAGVAALLEALVATGRAAQPMVDAHLVDLLATDAGSKEARFWFQLHAAEVEPTGTAGEPAEALTPVDAADVRDVLAQARAALPRGVEDAFDVACWDEAGCRIATTQPSNEAIAMLLERLESACALGPGCEAWLTHVRPTADGGREAELMLTVVR